MVLKEIKFLNENHKLVILGSMAIGVLYPFFTDFSIFGLDNPKFILIGLLLAGMMLFWEIYGNKQYGRADQVEYKQRQVPYPPQQYPQPPQYNPSFQHPSNYGDQLFNEANNPINQETPRPKNPIYHHTQYTPRREDYYNTPGEPQVVESEEYEEPNLPRVSDVVKRKVRLPDRIPPPERAPVKRESPKSFRKF